MTLGGAPRPPSPENSAVWITTSASSKPARAGVQAVCSCGWRSPIFGADKTGGTMDALQRGVYAGDLHQREASLR
jgi:hypothetical protein